MAKRQTKLSTVTDSNPVRDSIISARVTPAFKGNDQEDGLCGGCGVVLFEGVSVSSLGKNLVPTSGRLIARCGKCGADNLISTSKLKYPNLGSAP